MIICDGKTVPNEKQECREAVNTQGWSCRKCERSDCYRQGWAKPDVDRDNRRLVREKNARR